MALVLIVEDEAQVRVLAEGIVQELGHEVLTAGTVDEALALLSGNEGVDLLFTDLKLLDRHHGGIEVAPHAREAKPEVRVIYTTGEGVNDGTRALFVEDFHFLSKPYPSSSEDGDRKCPCPLAEWVQQRLTPRLHPSL